MAAHPLEQGLVIAGRYRILRLIGEGGMGAVYLVEHQKTDERFALKVLHAKGLRSKSALERFHREARTPARIDSDHVVRVVDSDVAPELDDAPFLVMEFIRGRSLEDLSEELGSLSPEEAIVYLRQIAVALDRAHAIGVVHRDLKPENLLLTTRDDGSPCVKVLDFGIAKLTGATGDLARVKATGTGEVFGTPLYMSPEQCNSEADQIGPQSDIWSLGLVAHRLLTGEDFWQGGTLVHLVAQIAYEPIPKPSEQGYDYGPEYDEWFARCCARPPQERFATATEAVMALATALAVPTETRASRRGLLRAAELARREPTATAQPSTGGGKHTSSALTRTDRALEGTSKTRWRLLSAVAAGTAVGVLVVAWLGDSLWRSGDATPAADHGTLTATVTPAATAVPTESDPAQATATPTASATAELDAGPNDEPDSSAGVPSAPRPAPQPPTTPTPQPPPPASVNPYSGRY